MAAAPQTVQEKYDLIAANLQEVLNPEIIKEVLEKNERPLVIYWGTATTGRPHCGYFVPTLKIAEFLRAGCTVKVLLADIHGFLDNLKAPIELVKFRAEYYRYVIVELLRAVGVPTERLEFVLGSSYQLTAEYTMDRFRLESVVTQHDARKAGSEVVKQVDNATLSSLIYPVMQALDEEYLKVDAQFGGVDQRKIFALAKDILPRIGYRERAHLMNPMVPGLAGGKMSASDPDSKIDLLDSAEVVKKKLKKAFAPPKQIEENGLISFVEYVLLPAGALKHGEPRFVVERREGEGEPLVYNSVQKLHDDYKADILTPQLLKSGVTNAINELLAPIQAAFQASKEWQDIEKLAYPPPPVVEKKKKEKKDKGKFHPGAAKAAAQADGSVEGPDAAEVGVGKDVDAALSNLKVADKQV
ncbi:hypothetical protein MBLNU459_g2698t1 [Dothideomycetes sp. NU459]